MRTKGLALLVLCLLAALWAVPAVAQEQTGSIEGVVKDASGAVLPGVTVEARSPQAVGVNTAVTDAQGIYRFPALPPGEYTITARLQGFDAPKIQATIALGKLLKVDIAMSVAGRTETVQVTGEAPLIDVRQSASFATVERTLMEKIPRGRDFTTVVSVAPGTNNESYAGGIQVDGASGSENRFIVDGMDTTAIRTGVSNKTVLVDFIQEVQVKSSGYNAEFGGATGGVINVLGKSGSNNIHGGAGFYYTGNLWRGPVRAGWRINPYTDDGVVNGDVEQAKSRDNDKWNNWNPIGDIGGPIIKDRLWYYAGMSQDRNDYSRTVKYMNSDPVGIQKTFDWFEQRRYLNWNASTQITNNMRVKVSGAHQWNTDRGGAPSFEREGSTFSDLSGAAAVLNGQSTDGGWTKATYYSPDVMHTTYDLVGSDYTNQMYSGNLDWVIKPTFFVNVTAGALTYNTTQPSDFAANSPRVYYPYSNMTYSAVPTDLRHPSGWYNIDKTNSLTQRQYYQRLFFNFNNIWYKSAAGQHTFKFGVRYEHLSNDINDGYQGPIFSIYWNRSRTTGDGRSVRGTYGYYRARTFGTYGQAKSGNWALWAQDSWSINNKLTINAGLRTEHETIPGYTTGSTVAGTAITFGFGDKLAPRVGFAYDMKGDGKWKAYGSYGKFYDLMKLGISIMSFGGEVWKDWYFTLDTYDWSQIKCNPVNSSDRGDCGPGKVIESIDYRYNSFSPDPATKDLVSQYFGHPVTNTIDPSMKPYTTDEITLGLDHELSPTSSVGVRYVRKRLGYAIEDVGVKILPTADNPSGVEVYFIANPGYGVTKNIVPAFPQVTTPPAKRDYDSVELRYRKRLSNAWSVNASYTWSRLFGNYSGLASSDESGRTDPNTSRYFDALYMSYNASAQEVEGPLYTDRPHQVKVQATYDFTFGTSVGLNALYQSGMPVGALVDWQGYPVFITTRDSIGRTPFQQRYDLYLQHDIRVTRNHRINLAVNIDNVFDLKTITDYNQTINRDSLAYSDATFFAGFDPFKLTAQQEDTRINPLVVNANGKIDPKPYSYMGRRAFRFNVRYSF